MGTRESVQNPDLDEALAVPGRGDRGKQSA